MDLKDGLVPDLANPPKVRRKRAPKHDFKDGAGRVFAHRHAYGGGWVADTAKVAESVKVTRNAQVSQFARIEDSCHIEGRAVVTGHARIAGAVRLTQDAMVGGNARVFDRAVISGRSRVSDNCLVGGTSHIEHNAVVAGWAHVINSRVSGPQNGSFYCSVAGYVRLLDSNVWGVSILNENAILHRTTANNVLISGGARFLDSNVATTVDSSVWSVIHRGGTLPNDQPVQNYLARFCGTFIRSVVNVPICTINDTVHFIGCRIMLHALPFQEFNNEIYANLHTNDPAALVSYSLQNIRGANNNAAPNIPRQQPNGAPVVASVGIVHNPETIRQRRIMRLERNES